MNINCLVFNDFETLDLFGPVEVFGKIEECTINYYSLNGGIIKNNDNIQIYTENMENIINYDVLIIPGGMGTRKIINDNEYIEKIKNIVEKSKWCLTVCTGSILLAKTGLLNNKEATTNKMVLKNNYDWIIENGKNVKWIKKARWVKDEKYYTSSGISAGIDMSLGFVNDQYGKEKADEIVKRMEYEWNKNKDEDNFV